MYINNKYTKDTRITHIKYTTTTHKHINTYKYFFIFHQLLL